MGIPGLIKEIGKGQRVALTKLAVEHLQRTKRPLRIAIDAAIWSFQNQASQGGLNPALRVFYFRLIRLLALPIHPLFVYDGPNKPKVKRNKKVGVWNSAEDRLSKKLLQLFHFPYLTAPGEAEAECAELQKCGIVDAVMSHDIDAVMFGSTLTLKNWTSEGSRGAHAPTHVDILDTAQLEENNGLDTAGMILVALLSGGDYDTTGLPGFGPTIACEIAKLKEPNYAADLLAMKLNGDQVGLQQWRAHLSHELQTNEHKYFKRKNNLTIPENFPNDLVLSYYTQPAVSSKERLNEIEQAITTEWAKEVDLPQNIPLLREFTRDNFEWKYKSGARKFIRGLAPALMAQRLRLKQPMNGVVGMQSILSKGERFENDGIPEVRLQVVPSQIVPLDFSQEEDRPPDATQVEEGDEAAELPEGAEATGDGEPPSSQVEVPATPSKKRKSPPWDPDLPEKYWLSETIFKVGLPGVVRAWDLQQEELRKDPKKWATRKAKPKVKDNGMKTGAMDSFFKVSKAGVSTMAVKPNPLPTSTTSTTKTNVEPASSATRRQASSRPRATTKKTVVTSSQSVPSIARFFQPHAQAAEAPLTMVRDIHTTSITRPGSTTTHEIIEIPSSPMSPWVPPPLLSSLQDHAETSSVGAMNAAERQSSPDSLPSPSQLFSSPSRPGHEEIVTSFTRELDSSPIAFDAMPPRATSRSTQEGQTKKDYGRSRTRNRLSKSPSPTLKATFKTIKTESKVRKKIAAVGRDSLPGAWKEVDLTGEESTDIGRKTTSTHSRVSIVDMTDI